MKYNQAGSSHVVIVVAVVLVLIGALSVVFFQHRSKDVASSTATKSSSNQHTIKKQTDIVRRGNNLEITEWNIAVPATKNMVLVRRTQSDDGKSSYPVYEVSNESLRAEAKKLHCDDDSIGQIIQLNSLENGDPRQHVKINGKYYVYAPRSQAACIDNHGNSPREINNNMMKLEKAFDKMFSNIKAA